MNEETIKQFLKKKNIFAVVGASKNPEKYGHQVYKDLKGAGYEVYPVSPNVEEILGDECYPNLTNLPKKPDVADLVVPPKVTEEIVKTCKKCGSQRYGCNLDQNPKPQLNSVTTTA